MDTNTVWSRKSRNLPLDAPTKRFLLDRPRKAGLSRERPSNLVPVEPLQSTNHDAALSEGKVESRTVTEQSVVAPVEGQPIALKTTERLAPILKEQAPPAAIAEQVPRPPGPSWASTVVVLMTAVAVLMVTVVVVGWYPPPGHSIVLSRRLNETRGTFHDTNARIQNWPQAAAASIRQSLYSLDNVFSDNIQAFTDLSSELGHALIPSLRRALILRNCQSAQAALLSMQNSTRQTVLSLQSSLAVVGEVTLQFASAQAGATAIFVSSQNNIADMVANPRANTDSRYLDRLRRANSDSQEWVTTIGTIIDNTRLAETAIQSEIDRCTQFWDDLQILHGNMDDGTDHMVNQMPADLYCGTHKTSVIKRQFRDFVKRFVEHDPGAPVFTGLDE